VKRAKPRPLAQRAVPSSSGMSLNPLIVTSAEYSGSRCSALSGVALASVCCGSAITRRAHNDAHDRSGGVWLGAHHRAGDVVRPLQTVSNVLAALRELITRSAPGSNPEDALACCSSS